VKPRPLPWIRTPAVPPPGLQDNTADADRLLAALKADLKTRRVTMDLALTRRLPDLLRRSNFRPRCVVFRDRSGWLLLDALRPDQPSPAAGIAVDLGTTRVVLRLLDLADGRVLAETAFDNPQQAVGPDVLSRLHHAEKPGGLQELNRFIIEGLNRAVEELCRLGRLRPEAVYLLAVAGNTAMTHLFLRLPPRWMIREPYIPAVNRPPVEKAVGLGIRANPAARVLTFPNVGSYFGGDLIAGILSCGLHRREETSILVDVGTNAEVVLGNRHWMAACAGAAGPALEGGMSRMGTTAAPGVIDRVAVDPQSREIRVHTIGDLPPRGICGSGVIDLAAGLFQAGMIDVRGKLVAERCGPRYKVIAGQAHLLVAAAEHTADGRELTISQAELDSLIRSKAAMYTILETITAAVGIAPEGLERFYVAGTFGSFIDPRSAVTIGMLPDLPAERFRALGNSSLAGATMALASSRALAEIDRIRDGITYMELNVNQDFMNRFSAARFLPHTDTQRFPSVRLPSA